MRSTVAAGTAAAVLLVGGLGAARAVERSADSGAERGARERAKASSAVFDGALGALTRTIGIVEILSERRAPSPQLARLLGASGVVAVTHLSPADEAVAMIAGTLPPGATTTTLASGTRLAREAATDTGEAHIAVPARGTIAIVVPTYAAGATIDTTGERRRALTRWVVATIDGRAFLSRIGHEPDEAMLTIDGAVAAGSAVAARGRLEVAIDRPLANSAWRLRIRPALPGGLSTAATSVLVSAVVAALAVLLVGVRDRMTIDRVEAGRDELLREIRLVGELGPILQGSLDLGEVLPAVGVHLSDQFGLTTLALDLIGDDGSLVEMFSMGQRPAATSGTDGDGLPNELVCPLVRSGRTIGRLRVIPGRSLTDAEIAAIRAAAELVAVTTSNVELYEREQATVRRLTELDRLKDAFLGTISHELRTPITAISGFVELLCERWGDFGDEDRQEFLRRIQRNSTSLGLLVDDLLDFARLERQSIVVTPTPMRLDLAAASLVRQLTPLLGQHHVTTELDAEVIAVADPSALDRVLANLLTNAAKFSPPGSTVRVEAHATTEYAELTVSDEGAGIAAEDRRRVFTRFYRGDSPAARSTRGAGIGLAVVRELVVQMGGEISVHDNTPHGARVTVRLPVPSGGPLRIPDQTPASALTQPARRN